MSSTPYDHSYTMADALRDGITVLLAEMGQEVDGKPAPSHPLVATRAIARALGGVGIGGVHRIVGGADIVPKDPAAILLAALGDPIVSGGTRRCPSRGSPACGPS